MAQPIPTLRVTLRAVLLFEKLSARSFASIDFQDKDDAELFIYCLQRNTPGGILLPYDLWRSILKSEAISAGYYKSLGRAIEELGEISLSLTKENSEEADALGVLDEEPATFTSIATLLIVEGSLSPDYVMDHLELWELPALLSALEQKKREKLEHSRLFTWLTMLPHLAQDSADSPEALLPFPWEKDKRDEERTSIYDLIHSATYIPESN